MASRQERPSGFSRPRVKNGPASGIIHQVQSDVVQAIVLTDLIDDPMSKAPIIRRDRNHVPDRRGKRHVPLAPGMLAISRRIVRRYR